MSKGADKRRFYHATKNNPYYRLFPRYRRSIAMYFAARGYHVFINCRTSLRELEKVRQEIDKIGSGLCTIVPGDVGDPAAVEEIFQKIQTTAGHLDILVNNAGNSHIGLLTDMTIQEWDQVIRANLSSVFYCCRAAIPTW